MNSGKKIFIGVLLLSFLAMTYLGVEFIMELPKYEVGKTFEKFTNKKGKFTLASECNCLPGYIPSKDVACKTGTEYICKRLCNTGEPNCNPLTDVRACY